MPRILDQDDITGFRQRLCDAAARLFAENGHGFTMRDLAKSLGVSTMTTYRYFEDKHEILAVLRARAFARLADQLEDAVAAASDLCLQSAALGRAYAAFALQEKSNYRLMFDPPLLTSPPLGGEASEHRVRAVIAGHIRKLSEAGLVQGDVAALTHALWSSLHGAASLYIAGRLSEAEFRNLSEPSVFNAPAATAMTKPSAQGRPA